MKRIIILFSIIMLFVSCNKNVTKIETKDVTKLTKAEQLDRDYHLTIDSITEADNLEKLNHQINELHKMDSIAKSVTTIQQMYYDSSLAKNGKEYTDSVSAELYKISMYFTQLVSLKMMLLKNNSDSTTILEVNNELVLLNKKFKSVRYK